MVDKETLKEFILFQLHRNIVNLYKRYINITEDLQYEHSLFLKKLEKDISPAKLKEIDYFPEAKYNHIRKKILDSGNEISRDLSKVFDTLDISLNKKKIDEFKQIYSYDPRLVAAGKKATLSGGKGEKNLKLNVKIL